tara:strand:+ start:2331 stop:2753 length:423 start_codon:yes stop_codon:yes gene_type:complete
MKFAKICSNLRELEGIDKFEYLFSLAKKNEGIPDVDKTDLNRIFGCTSTAYLIVKQHDPVQIITDSDSQFVKGLLYILQLYVNDESREHILTINHVDLMDLMGMENAISSQRTNGFYAAIVKLQKILNNCEDFKNGKKGN